MKETVFDSTGTQTQGFAHAGQVYTTDLHRILNIYLYIYLCIYSLTIITIFGGRVSLCSSG